MTTKLYLFGTPRLEQNGETVPLPHRKAVALLAYLAMTGQAHSRDALATLLWPEHGQKAARTNLRQNFAQLRDRLGQAAFVADREQIARNPDAPLGLDVAEFQAEIAAAQQCSHPPTTACATCLPHLRAAVAAYTDDFLAGFTLADSPDFDDWQFFERESLRQSLATALQQLIHGYSAQRDVAAAIPYARRWVDLDLLHEPAHRQLMTLYAHAGQQAAALRQYQRCIEILREELDVPPEPETTALFEEIRNRKHGTGNTPIPHAPNLQSPISPSPTPPPPFQVIASPPHFVGRTAEIEEVRNILRQPGAQRVALVGMGGLGKTTLAIQAAHQLRNDFADGVLWANPTISSIMDVMDSWGRAYGYDFSGLGDVESRGAAVRGVLAEKAVLLVLDNVMQVAAITPLLAGSEESAILLTTRDLDVAHALNAQVIALGELSAESGRALLVNVLGEERVHAEEEAAAEICQRLHYLPLAVEIAAQRLQSRTRMKLTQMAARLANEAQRLGLEISDRAVRTSFEVSWQALDPELQAIFPLLAVFEGRPFTAEALAYIADLDPFDAEDALFGLSALSLVKEDQESYYRQHPLLTDFAREKLTAGPHIYRQHELVAEITKEKAFDLQTAYGRLVDYYLEFVGEHRQNYAALEVEWGNISAAIRIAHDQAQWAQVLAFTDLLAQSWLTRGRYDDARAAYQWAQDAAVQLADEARQATNLLHWGEVCIEQSDYAEAQTHLTHSLQLALRLEEDAGIADAQSHLARIALERNEYEEAEELLDASLAIREFLGDTKGLAAIFYDQAYLHFERNDLERAAELSEQALQYQEKIDDQSRMIPTLRLLALIAEKCQSFEIASLYCERAKTLSEARQDDTELAAVHYVMAIIQRRQSNFAAARTHAEIALPLFRRFGLRRYEGLILYQLSTIFYELEDYERALTCNLASIKIFDTNHNTLGRLFALILLGDLYQVLEQPEQSQSVWQDAQKIADRLNHRDVQKQLQQRMMTN